MGDAVLMFGIGATKAGTTWLYRYLAGHPDCHLHSIKELHFFDTLDLGTRGARLKTLGDLRARLLAKQGAGKPGLDRRLSDVERLMALVADGNEDDYLAYLNADRKHKRLIADITPAYSLLSEGRLKRMAGMAAQVRFIYLMRDPVDRLWSHVRMIARRRSETGRDITRRAGAILGRVLRGEEAHIAARGDYRGVLTRIGAALNPAQGFLTFYEELFARETTDRLCAFLGIGAGHAALPAPAHVGVPLEMTPAQRAETAAWLKPQYDFVAARMGRLPTRWEANMVGV